MRQSHCAFSVLACFACASLLLGAPDQGAAPPPPPARPHPIRVLLITGGHGFEHDAFMNVFKSYPDIQAREVTQPEALAYFAPEKAGEYDVMVWYDLTQKIGETDKKNLIELLEKGKPLVALHHCLSDYLDWPEAGKIIGGRYWLDAGPGHEKSTYHGNEHFKVHIADPEHPITRFMHDFELTDEVYGNLEVMPDVKPLLTVDHPKSNKLIAWTHTYGKSPVVYLQLGHGPGAYSDPSYRRLVAQSIRWAAGALPDPKAEGFVDLLKSGDFDGWKFMADPKGFWWTDAGTLRSESQKGGEWIRTDKEYGDFALRVEWKIGDGGNSGVFIRCLDKEKGYPWETGSEVQISNEPRDALHCTGSLYGSVTVDPRPDESANIWHEFWIECRGPFYKVFSDNIPIIDVDSRVVPALAKRPLRGFIGLQDSHNRESYVEFRRVAVKELPANQHADRERVNQTVVWKLGTQAFTFRLFSFYEAIDKAKALGLKYIEGYPGQVLRPDRPGVTWDYNASPEVREQVKKKLAESGVKLVNYGVVGLWNKEEELQTIFKFAKDMGIETLTAEPDPAAMEMIDKLANEYQINVAIHNHPKSPLTRYWNPDQVLEVVKGRSRRIGACADVGHWVRSGLDPVDCLKKLRGRVITLHFKDLNERSKDAHDVVWGTGISKVQGMLEELKHQRFSGVFSAEYEYNWENNSPDLAESFKYFRMVAEKLGQKVE